LKTKLILTPRKNIICQDAEPFCFPGGFPSAVYSKNFKKSAGGSRFFKISFILTKKIKNQK